MNLDDELVIDDELITAAKKGNLVKCRELIKAGADVNAKDKYSRTVLDIAKINGNAEVVNLLIGIRTKFKQLVIAAEKGKIDQVKALIEAGADANATDEDGRTALMCAAGKGHFDVVNLLIEAGADANTTDEDGGTALMEAALFGHLDVARLLIENGANVNIKDKWGKTALIWAQEDGREDIVALLEGDTTPMSMWERYYKWNGSLIRQSCFKYKKKGASVRTRLCLFLKPVLVQSVFQKFSRFEFRLFGSRNLDRGTGARIATGRSRTFRHAERAKADQANFVAFFQCRGNRVQQGFRRFFGINFRQTGVLRDFSHQFCFVHNATPHVKKNVLPYAFSKKQARI